MQKTTSNYKPSIKITFENLESFTFQVTSICHLPILQETTNYATHHMKKQGAIKEIRINLGEEDKIGVRTKNIVESLLPQKIKGLDPKAISVVFMSD